MTYPTEKSNFPVRVPDDEIPASDFNTQAEAINEIQDALGYGNDFMKIANNIYPKTDEGYDLGYLNLNWRYIYCGGTVFTNTVDGRQGFLHIQTGGLPAIFISGSQNVAIGNDTPTEKLEVNGNIKINNNGLGLILKTPDGTKDYKITIDNSGNIISTLV